MKQENVEFLDALRTLAKRAGVELKPVSPKLKNEKTRILEVLAHAARFFKAVLDHEQAGSRVRHYLSQRGVPEDLWLTYALGYAPDQWDALSRALKKKGYTDKEIINAGLALSSPKGGVYDRFRDRLIFPIKNTGGEVVGFGGRALGDDAHPSATDSKGPKYMNSPQTLVYDKSRTLYGLYEAKKSLREKKEVVLVEGYLDVLASVKAGVSHTVAVSGTAVTPDSVRVLKRFAPLFLFSFDADTAGQEAAKRGVLTALQEGVEVRVVPVPYGKDPDECVQHDPDLWKKAVAQAQPFMEYSFTQESEGKDLSQVVQKKKMVQELLPLVSALADEVEQTHWLQKLSGLVNVQEHILRDRLSQKKSATPTAPQTHAATSKSSISISKAEQIIGLCITYPAALAYIAEHIEPEMIVDNSLQDIYRTLLLYYTTHIGSDPSQFQQEDFFGTLKEAHAVKSLALRIERDFEGFAPEDIQREAALLSTALYKEWVMARKSELTRSLTTATSDREEVIYKEINRLNRELAHLS